MPTLAAEPMIWPDRLFDETQDGTWWVLHVKPRAEKSFARKCHNNQSYFLPQYRQPRGQARRKESYALLFPGYVFLFGSEDSRVAALQTNLVANVLTVPNQQELFEDLKRIHQVIASDLQILPVEKLQPGAAVAIIDGPLVGLHGTVIRRKNKTTILLKVSFLQQGASVEIDNSMVEPLQRSFNI